MRRKNWFARHSVTFLGIAAGVIPGFLGIQDLIAEPHKKYWLAAGVLIGVLTTQQGLAKAKQEKQP